MDHRCRCRCRSARHFSSTVNNNNNTTTKSRFSASASHATLPGQRIVSLSSGHKFSFRLQKKSSCARRLAPSLQLTRCWEVCVSLQAVCSLYCTHSGFFFFSSFLFFSPSLFCKYKKSPRPQSSHKSVPKLQITHYYYSCCCSCCVPSRLLSSRLLSSPPLSSPLFAPDVCAATIRLDRKRQSAVIVLPPGYTTSWAELRCHIITPLTRTRHSSNTGQLSSGFMGPGDHMFCHY